MSSYGEWEAAIQPYDAANAAKSAPEIIEQGEREDVRQENPNFDHTAPHGDRPEGEGWVFYSNEHGGWWERPA